MNCRNCGGKLKWMWGSPEKDGAFEERFHCTSCDASHTRKVQYDVTPISDVTTLDVERGGSPPEGVERTLCTDRECKDGYYMDDLGDMVQLGHLFPVSAIHRQVYLVNGFPHIVIKDGKADYWYRLELASNSDTERFVDCVMRGEIAKFPHGEAVPIEAKFRLPDRGRE